VVFSSGKVIMSNVFALQLPGSQTALKPEVAGVEIGDLTRRSYALAVMGVSNHSFDRQGSIESVG
jgi:hypothetical protein